MSRAKLDSGHVVRDYRGDEVGETGLISNRLLALVVEGPRVAYLHIGVWRDLNRIGSAGRASDRQLEARRRRRNERLALGPGEFLRCYVLSLRWGRRPRGRPPRSSTGRHASGSHPAARDGAAERCAHHSIRCGGNPRAIIAISD